MYPALLRYMSILFVNILTVLALIQSADNLLYLIAIAVIVVVMVVLAVVVHAEVAVVLAIVNVV